MSRLGDHVEKWINGEVDLAPITDLLGIRGIAAGDGQARIELAADAKLHNAMGTLHGGVLCDLADVAMGAAIAPLVDDDESFATLQMTIGFLRPVREDRLTATARVVHRGRTTGHLECDIRDSSERLVARVTSICAIRRPG